MDNQVKPNRDEVGKSTSIIGIIVNSILAVGKIVLGIISGAISVLADGLNNLTDCGSSIISTISFKLSSKPADKEHPYGHERIEYVCSLAVAFLILLVAFETIMESVNKIIAPIGVDFSIVLVLVLVVSILAKLCLFIYYRAVAKRINSDILKATATDSLTDSISTFVVLASLCVYKFTGVNVDGYAGILVAAFIAYSAVGILKDMFSKLIGQAVDEQMLFEIKRKIMTYTGVLGVHDLSVYSYGPNKYFASAHIEVDASVDVLVSHELVDFIEKSFIEDTNIVLTGHLDPIVVDDERVNQLKEKVETIINEINECFTIHDFRVVFGENRTNVLFDVAVPYALIENKNQIKQTIEKRIKTLGEQYYAVITVEPTN
ncbi:MAG: cation transporter [Clostridiales bacterium]|nr:cation transporter [Clostridiales bacterium]MBE5754792.1 cation transporter [Clostridiales bacterium]